MKIYKINAADTGTTLYEGIFATFKDCLEQAVREAADLSAADLKNRNLTGACLDDGIFNGADFSGSNLAGANLSEARLHGASFRGADLYNTCMACADLQNCNFEDASFGGTDIAGSNISFARFSTLSCFTLDFAGADRLENCTFTNHEYRNISWSAPPIVIRGIGRKIYVFAEQSWMHGGCISPYPAQIKPILSADGGA
jgi:uncharacterized protein YjbI with pentapeptide repeats